MASDTPKWKQSARIVAYLDLIGSAMLLFPLLAISIIAWMVTLVFLHPELNDDQAIRLCKSFLWDSEKFANEDQLKMAILRRLWFALVIFGTFVWVGLWAAVELMKATEIGRDSKQALRLCNIWRNVSIITTVIVIIGHFSIGTGSLHISTGIVDVDMSLVGCVLTRGAYIFIVSKFMESFRPRDRVKLRGKRGKGSDETKVIILYY